MSALRSLSSTALAGLFSLFVLVPLFLVFTTSLKDRLQIAENPLGLPTIYLWENFLLAWENGNFGLYFRNSIMITLPTVACVLVFSLVAAYAFAILTFPRENSFIYLLFSWSYHPVRCPCYPVIL
ncbi:MAG: carbohydrate ABC transporter permease [Anaerolineae bacterium]|nr:carbohydrate ABC transporter permease [Anaerolineae bacterium]